MKLAIISDIHEDVVNLRLALAKIEKTGCDEIACIGDISGFSVPHAKYFHTRNARECLRLVKENCKYIIAGNHDLNACSKIPAISPEFEYPKNWYSLDYHERKKISGGKLWLYLNDELSPLYAKADIEFITSLPEYQVLENEKGNILLSHYAYPNLTGSLKAFYFDATEYKSHFTFMQTNNCTVSITGHMHSPGLYIVTEEKVLQKRLGKSFQLNEPANVSIPSVAEGHKSGFCVLNTSDFSVQAVKI